MVDLNEPWRSKKSGATSENSAAKLNTRPRYVSVAIEERCAKEWRRPSISWAPNPGPWKDAVGVFYGLRFPWTERTVKWLGPPWLTKAFRAAGTLTDDGEVTNIISLRSLGCRGAAERLLLTVEYGPGQMGMHTKLLVKVPLEDSERFGVKRSERAEWKIPVGSLPPLRPIDYFAEINFYRLYERDAPFRMPKYYYGDISDRTSKYILITEWVPLPGETDDARQGEVAPLYAAEPTATLDAEYASMDEHTFLIGPHGGYLCLDPSGTILSISHRKDESTTWTLRPADADRTKHYLISPSFTYLAAADKREQSMYFSNTACPDAQWTLIHATGERHKVFLKSSHNTYLASLNDVRESLYMSPHADDWEKWRRVPAQTIDAAADSTHEHLELRGADYEVCQELVEAGAAFAGAHKDGRLGSRETIETAFERQTLPAERLFVRDEEWRGLGDTEFIEKASVAQEFILKMGKALFPEGVVTAATMKGYRAMLVTTRANLDHIRWWCMSREDYVALGHDRIDMDSAFRWHRKGTAMRNDEDRSGTGLRDWESVSVGPLGFKIWAWLRFAESDVLQNHADNLLRVFIRVYAASGGPMLQLEDLRNQMYLAAALDSVQLLSAVPEIYRCWPKDKWTSIKGLRDKRVLGQTLGQQSLWLCLKSLVNIALVLSTCDMVELLSQVMPLIFHTVVHEATPSEEFLTGPDGAEVRAGPEPGSPLICRLPENTPLTGTGRWAEVERKKTAKSEAGEKQLAEVKLPVYGWVDFEDIEPVEDRQSLVDPTTLAACDILERMYHTRRQYTGFTPLGMSAISTMKLMDTLKMYDKMFQVLKRFGHGDCQMVTGGFLVEETRRKWWPKGYEDWAHHTFLVFDDGSIADITADQYDDVPQLWYPAEERRYTFDSSKPDNSEYMREQFGVKKWTESVERDRGIPAARKKHKWWTENQSPMLPDSMRAPRKVAGKGKEAIRKSLKGAEEDFAVLRDGQPIKLPPVSRHVDMGEGRQPAAFRRISEENELEVWLVENIFQNGELEDIVRLCDSRGGFEPSLQNASSGLRVQDGRRTSESCSVHWPLLWSGDSLEKALPPGIEEELFVAGHISGLCARALELDQSYIEPLQLVKYTAGQYYGRHMDTHKEPDRLSSHNGEQRTHTLLVFLTDVPPDDGGGHLHFPLLRLRFLPRAGAAVLWRNTRVSDGKPDPNSLHEGEPPIKSEKIAMNVWVVDRPFTVESVNEGRQRKLMLAEKASSQALQVARPAQAPGEKEPLLLRKLRERAEYSEDSDDEPPARQLPKAIREVRTEVERPAFAPTIVPALVSPGASALPLHADDASKVLVKEAWKEDPPSPTVLAEEPTDALDDSSSDCPFPPALSRDEDPPVAEEAVAQEAKEPMRTEKELYDLAGDCPYSPPMLDGHLVSSAWLATKS